MANEIAFENGRISDFEGLVTLTLTQDRVILITVVHRSLISTYMSNFTEIKERFCGWTDGRTHKRTYVRMHGQTGGHLRPALLGRLCRKDDRMQIKTDSWVTLQ